MLRTKPLVWLGLRCGVAQRALLLAAVVVAGLSGASHARGRLDIAAPERKGLECIVTFFDLLTRDVTTSGPAKLTVVQDWIALQAPIPEARVVLRDTQTGQVAIKRVKLDERGNGLATFTDKDFFTPKTLELVLVSSGRPTDEVYQVQVTSSDKEAYTQRVTNVELERVTFDTLRGGQTEVVVSAGDTPIFEKTLEIPKDYSTLRIPVPVDVPSQVSYIPSGMLFESSGKPEGAVFLGVSVFLFILAAILWVASTFVIAAMPQVFDIDRHSNMRKAAVPTLAVCGAILLGNGVGLIVLGEAEYLAVVASIGCVQLALLFWLILAVQARHNLLIWAGTAGVIAGLFASIIFVPALVVEGDEYGVTVVVSLVQIGLVLLAIACMVVTRFRERLHDNRRGVVDLRRRCPYCGMLPNPITGLCACAPKGVKVPDRPVARLTIKSGGGAMAQTLIGSSASIGREPSCDVRLDDDPAVSRHHAMIYTQDGEVVLRDVGSSNGTFVNGERISEKVLHDGDTVQVGESWILFERLQ